MNSNELRSIYLEALERCRPSLLLEQLLHDRPDLFRDLPVPASVIALGKAAAELVQGAVRSLKVGRCFVAMPTGYGEGLPPGVELHLGSHPEPTETSFKAGEALQRFAKSCDAPVLLLISGGSSACVEAALKGFTRSELVHVNRSLLRAGWDIERINTVRKHLSAIKGGRLGRLLPAGSLTLVLSDVSAGRPKLVGSGPTFPDPTTNAHAADLLETLGDPALDGIISKLRDSRTPDTPKPVVGTRVNAVILGDNRTLRDAAGRVVRKRGREPLLIERELEDEVSFTAEFLHDRAATLGPNTIVIAGGEPTVRIRGDGMGGRCSELAVRFARLMRHKGTHGLLALFGSSDGRDGNTGAAGYVISAERVGSSGLSLEQIDQALDSSDSFRLIKKIGEAIIIPPTGNNLRDLFLLART